MRFGHVANFIVNADEGANVNKLKIRVKIKPASRDQ